MHMLALHITARGRNPRSIGDGQKMRLADKLNKENLQRMRKQDLAFKNVPVRHTRARNRYTYKRCVVLVWVCVTIVHSTHMHMCTHTQTNGHGMEIQ